MTDVLFVAGLIVGAIALTVAPLFLPWPWEVRWIVAARELNPLIALHNARRHIQLDEVVLVDFASDRAALVIVVEPERTMNRGRTELVGAPCSIGDLAALDGWHGRRTPLLLVEDAGGVATLQGPHRAITGLHETHHHPRPLVA